MEIKKNIINYVISLSVALIFLIVFAMQYLIGISAFIFVVLLIIFHYKFVKKNFKEMIQIQKENFFKDLIIFQGKTIYYILYCLSIFIGILDIITVKN